MEACEGQWNGREMLIIIMNKSAKAQDEKDTVYVKGI